MPENPELPILPSKHEMHLWLTAAVAAHLVGAPRASHVRHESGENRQALEPTAPASGRPATSPGDGPGTRRHPDRPPQPHA
jgi:hypothetical protein